MYRFALRPRWLVGHVVALALVVGLAGLGFWQLGRLDERKAFNEQFRRRSETTVALDQVASPDNVPDDAVFRRVRVTGRFDAGTEALVRFRIRDGLPGYEALTPLVVNGRTAVLVDRGWLPLDMGDALRPDTAVPPGEVTVTGLLLEGEGAGRFRPEQRPDGRLVVGAVTVAELERRLGYDLYPGFVQLQDPDDPDRFPAPLPEPDLSEGPHLTYAMQWFSFATIAAGGWVLLVRASAKRQRSRPPGPTTPGH
ncbi:MAG TPA: SURF1 family protein [Acidimicrobiales bacterium]|nr:SURF1 family protein [Acidimicrobiales bacterium]